MSELKYEYAVSFTNNKWKESEARRAVTALWASSTHADQRSSGAVGKFDMDNLESHSQNLMGRNTNLETSSFRSWG